MNLTGWQSGGVALALSLLLTPVVKRLCDKFRLYDFPGPLKVHAKPIPHLGGVAVVAALTVSLGLGSRHGVFPLWPFLLGLFLTCVTGLLDDLLGLSPEVRIVSQLAAGAILWHAGWRIPIAGNALLSLAGTCFFVAVFVNACNFLDGADGILAGISAAIAAGYAVLPVSQHTDLGAAGAWNLLGVACGFLAYNYPPAKIFLGDSGSTAIGFCVAFLGLDFYRASGAPPSSLPFPILLAALPLVDFAFAVIRRLQSRVSILFGDRRHGYDLLLGRGWSTRRVALTCYAITIALVILAEIARRLSPLAAFILFALPVGLLVAAAISLGCLQLGDEKPGVDQVRT